MWNKGANLIQGEEGYELSDSPVQSEIQIFLFFKLLIHMPREKSACKCVQRLNSEYNLGNYFFINASNTVLSNGFSTEKQRDSR